MTEDTLLPFDLPAVRRKKVTAGFDGGLISSDGGLVLLREAERRLRLADTLAGSMRDRRDPASVSSKRIADVRRECHARRADPKRAETASPARAVPLFRDFVAGPWKEAHFDRYKPSTKKGVRAVLASRILPAFGPKPLDRITPAQVSRWFDTFSGTAPGGANNGLGVLRQIMNFAIACGHIDMNPTRRIRPNRRPRLSRFLSREEIDHAACMGSLTCKPERGGGSRLISSGCYS